MTEYEELLNKYKSFYVKKRKKEEDMEEEVISENLELLKEEDKKIVLEIIHLPHFDTIQDYKDYHENHLLTFKEGRQLEKSDYTKEELKEFTTQPID